MYIVQIISSDEQTLCKKYTGNGLRTIKRLLSYEMEPFTQTALFGYYDESEGRKTTQKA